MLGGPRLARLAWLATSICWSGLAFGQTVQEFSRLELELTLSEDHNPNDSRLPLLVHFHGAPQTTAQNFHEAGLSGVLLTINCHGLSSAYREPFENPALFTEVLEHARRELLKEGQCPSNVEWARIDVSCFSAGYGAVREFLKREQIWQQIDAVIAADSIYASIHRKGDTRTVDESQMRPFLDFARLAINDQKLFVISHSQLPVEPYASTGETADYLLSQVKLGRRSLDSDHPGAFEPIRIATKGSFTVLDYPGDDGEAHLQHLRKISVLWKKLKIARESQQR